MQLFSRFTDGSIEDLRISLSSILSEFDLNIERYRKSYSIELKEDKKANETPCIQRGSKIFKTEDSEENVPYIQRESIVKVECIFIIPFSSFFFFFFSSKERK